MNDEFIPTKLGRRSLAGDQLWSVIRWRAGKVLGGDHEWVRKRFALRAAALYRKHPELHGEPESVLREHGMRFDTDDDGPGPEWCPDAPVLREELDSDRSAMFTCLLSAYPGYRWLEERAGRELTTRVLAAWLRSEHTDMWQFARRYGLWSWVRDGGQLSTKAVGVVSVVDWLPPVKAERLLPAEQWVQVRVEQTGRVGLIGVRNLHAVHPEVVEAFRWEEIWD